jgi:hypothetical protein
MKEQETRLTLHEHDDDDDDDDDDINCVHFLCMWVIIQHAWDKYLITRK